MLFELCGRQPIPSKEIPSNDVKGFDASGEGLRLKMGEIPIVDILKIVNSSGRLIQGTIEVSNGHLYKGRFQMEAEEWLLTNARHVF